MTMFNITDGKNNTILPHCGPPLHTLYLAKGPAGPGARGGAPEENFWPIQRIFRQKTHTQTTYSTSFESPRRALHECGHTGV